ncbi:L-2-hydroxyglutarate oxidase [Paenibacillus ginsengarvi]|uniref:L-2-hydroxyglutarate oxidase n=1 Tax=Paenibacillus ginsengarvi TaxID=400777 RepID=A0A3B0CKW7_9BACL|nr:L-2-hydroxyglutarate oxidase [Paenibacillus ginsengarvi]RKN84987.1 L-2-hydroxyglutarate oxidase [Paenibacillus ginsengarvi]
MRCDYLIAGAGIVGLSIARELMKREPNARIVVIEKEADVAQHASGRNSGVLHAGFYYAADSLKARFTRDGNRAMKAYCKLRGIEVNECGKLVVAKDASELRGLEELKRRAERNGVELHWVDESEAARLDPNARTYQKALYSPTTASVDPVAVCRCLRDEIATGGVELLYNTGYKRREKGAIRTSGGVIECSYFINAAGLYADRIAHDFGFGTAYTIIPFKGIYLKYAPAAVDARMHIYPVPNLGNPFLGVHVTKTADGAVKIGPTAIPALWRENYKGLSRFRLGEFIRIACYETKLLWTNAFQFRRLALEEIKKYRKANLIGLALLLSRKLDPAQFGAFAKPGIRAQLLHKETLELVQDFVLEGDGESMHVLNAVSPAFTCSLPFAAYVVDCIEEKRSGKEARHGAI